MRRTRISRRNFCALSAQAAAAASSTLLRAGAFAAQPPAPGTGTATRPDVAAIDHDRTLSAAQRYLSLVPAPITSMVCPRSPATPADYYSEPERTAESPPAAPPPFLAHRDALFTLGLAVPALAAAFSLTSEAKYADAAAIHLRAWFIDPATRMTPAMDYAQSAVITGPSSGQPHIAGRYQGIIEALPLVEIAVAVPFLTNLSDTDRAAIRQWFSTYYHWLTDPRDSGPRLAALARDSRDHHGASWMLQASACAWLAAPAGDVGRAEDSALGDLRHRFKSMTLRAQIALGGQLPRELTTPAPYRNSLFTLDMLGAVCQLLSTRFESVWDYELEEGTGMRGAIAWHFPFMADRGRWPYRADTDHFAELPSRRSSLLFAARAYQRPEYAALWRTLQPDPSSPEVLRTIPVHQPLLWVRQPPTV